MAEDERSGIADLGLRLVSSTAKVTHLKLVFGMESWPTKCTIPPSRSQPAALSPHLHSSQCSSAPWLAPQDEWHGQAWPSRQNSAGAHPPLRQCRQTAPRAGVAVP